MMDNSHETQVPAASLPEEPARLEVEQVKVSYNSPMDPDEVRGFGADAVVLATGAQPAGAGFQKALPQVEILPGIDAGNVFSVDEVMARSARPGEHVLLLDDIGHWDGLGTALYLAEAGHRVTIVTWLPVIGATLIDLRDGEEKRIDADSLVLATIPAAEDWLARELDGSGLEILNIGDSVHPRRVHMAIHEGRKVGLSL